MKRVYICTDGACKGNPGQAVGRILYMKGGVKISGGAEQQITGWVARGNRGPFPAQEPCEVTLTTDSQYLVNSVTRAGLKAGGKRIQTQKRDRSQLRPLGASLATYKYS